MKTKILLALGAVTLAAFAVSATANDVLLSPRAADAQIKTVKSSASAGSLAAAKCPVIGSPKVVADAGRAARMSCCGMTLGACPSVAACKQ